MNSWKKIKNLLEPRKKVHKPKLYYEEVDLITEDEVFETTRKIFNKVIDCKGPGKILSWSNSIRSIKWRIINSLGLNHEIKETHNTISFSTIAIKDNQTATYYDYIYNRNLVKIEDANDKILETIKYTEKCVLKTPIETGEYPAIISPRTLVTLLSYTLYRTLTAKFHPRIIRACDMVGSKQLTIIGDPLNPEISNSTPIDHEGTPTRQMKIIENGEVKTLLYDHYYAQIEDMESTGNGFRTPISTWSRLTKPYQATPTPLISSILIKQGNKALKELASQIDKGIYIDTVIGAHGADPASGNFTSTAFKIENGAITKPVKHATITGNIKQILNIIDSTKQQKLVSNTIAPTVLIPKIKVA
ncbi:MAG: hypothetical protein DRP74_09180 [Candidatus Omnitrophota bacterium]|nr:MAG: hypothetical protein DRP74_09180 [Candidatus Omnitrophota bacterium]